MYKGNIKDYYIVGGRKMKKYKLYVALLLFSIYTFVTGEIEYQEIKENPKSVVNKIIADKSKENTKLNIKVNKLKITPIKLPPLVDRDENGNSYFLFDFPKEIQSISIL